MITAGGRRRALWFTIFWAIVGVASYVLGVRNELGQRTEDGVLDAAEFTTSPPPPLNLVSIPSVAITLVIIALIALAVHGVKRALVVTAVPVVAVVASQLLKQQLLVRPQMFELDLPNTFPSGHMTIFTVLIAGLMWAVPTKIRALITVLGAAVLAVAGWQLLAYGWHRPSDVIGGLALGTLAFSLVCLIRPATTRGRTVLGGITSIGLALVGWIVIAGALVLAVVAAINGHNGIMLSAGEIGSVGVSALAARALLLLSSGK